MMRDPNDIDAFVYLAFGAFAAGLLIGALGGVLFA